MSWGSCPDADVALLKTYFLMNHSLQNNLLALYYFLFLDWQARPSFQILLNMLFLMLFLCLFFRLCTPLLQNIFFPVLLILSLLLICLFCFLLIFVSLFQYLFLAILLSLYHSFLSFLISSFIFSIISFLYLPILSSFTAYVSACDFVIIFFLDIPINMFGIVVNFILSTLHALIAFLSSVIISNLFSKHKAIVSASPFPTLKSSIILLHIFLLLILFLFIVFSSILFLIIFASKVSFNIHSISTSSVMTNFVFRFCRNLSKILSFANKINDELSIAIMWYNVRHMYYLSFSVLYYMQRE